MIGCAQGPSYGSYRSPAQAQETVSFEETVWIMQQIDVRRQLGLTEQQLQVQQRELICAAIA